MTESTNRPYLASFTVFSPLVDTVDCCLQTFALEKKWSHMHVLYGRVWYIWTLIGKVLYARMLGTALKQFEKRAYDSEQYLITHDPLEKQLHRIPLLF